MQAQLTTTTTTATTTTTSLGFAVQTMFIYDTLSQFNARLFP
jgi:hypothetical protein